MIFYLMGKSASGKDTLFRRLLNDQSLSLTPIITYTTRPMRKGEQDGREYFFRNAAFLKEQQNAGHVLESRTYETVFGPWTYFTLYDAQWTNKQTNFLTIGTLSAYETLLAYQAKLVPIRPIYIEADNGTRLLRAIAREQTEKAPNYEEICRRFLTDESDFCSERLQKAGVKTVFSNNDLDVCLAQIKQYIIQQTHGG